MKNQRANSSMERLISAAIWCKAGIWETARRSTSSVNTLRRAVIGGKGLGLCAGPAQGTQKLEASTLECLHGKITKASSRLAFIE